MPQLCMAFVVNILCATYFISNFKNNQSCSYAVTNLAQSAKRRKYLLARKTSVPLQMLPCNKYFKFKINALHVSDKAVYQD